MIEGVKVMMGGKEWIVPALNLKQVRTLLPKIQDLPENAAEFRDDHIDGIVDVIHGALSRNYPEATREEVEDMVDLRNFQGIIMAIMAVSGLVVTDQGEPEAKQAEESQIGDGSTATLSPASDGVGNTSTTT